MKRLVAAASGKRPSGIHSLIELGFPSPDRRRSELPVPVHLWRTSVRKFTIAKLAVYLFPRVHCNGNRSLQFCCLQQYYGMTLKSQEASSFELNCNCCLRQRRQPDSSGGPVAFVTTLGNTMRAERQAGLARPRLHWYLRPFPSAAELALFPALTHPR